MDPFVCTTITLSFALWFALLGAVVGIALFVLFSKPVRR
jgi:hypothetical protein